MAKTPDITADELVAAYRALRDQMLSEKHAYEAKRKSLSDQLDVVSARLLEICNSQNIDSLRTASGTVMRKQESRYWTSDWDSMYDFIKEHDAFHLLERRLSNRNMDEFLEEHPDEMPVGLNVDRKYVVMVRKPTAKK